MLVLAPAIVVGSAALARRRVASRRDAVAPAHELSLDAADALARATRTRAAIEMSIVLAFIAVGCSTGVHSVVLVSFALAFGLQSYLGGWRVQQMLVLPRASAELRGTTLTVCSDGAHASAIVSRRAADAARQRTLPRAVVR